MDETRQHSAIPTGPEWTVPAGPPVRRRRAATAAMAGGLAVAVALGGAVVGHGIGGGTATASAATAFGGYGLGGTGLGSLSPYTDPYASTATATTRSATAAESVGVVDITTVLDYGAGEAAGTGIVLTASGEILTNNHVVAGSTSITVTVVSTGTAYRATVVGTDATDDVAVLQLANASGLATATLATSAVAVGDAVTAVGNAGGTGGTPTAATGTVTAVDQSITAGDESGTDSEQLTGMIQVDADIEAGDSGGPLYSATGAVVGIDTAASTGQGATVGFAIPIATAVAIADRIGAGEDSATISQGYPAFLGVQLGTTGLTIAGVVAGSPVAKAGLAAGDTITAVGGTPVTTSTALSTVLAGHDPGDRIGVTWTDGAGRTHTATITLAQGPVA